MTIPVVSRRRFQLGAAALALSILATGCGAPGGSGDNGQVTLRFAWWGNEYLNAQTNKVIAAFEASHPNIKSVHCCWTFCRMWRNSITSLSNL